LGLPEGLACNMVFCLADGETNLGSSFDLTDGDEAGCVASAETLALQSMIELLSLSNVVPSSIGPREVVEGGVKQMIAVGALSVDVFLQEIALEVDIFCRLKYLRTSASDIVRPRTTTHDGLPFAFLFSIISSACNISSALAFLV